MVLNNSELSFCWIFKYSKWWNSAWNWTLCSKPLCVGASCEAFDSLESQSGGHLWWLCDAFNFLQGDMVLTSHLWVWSHNATHDAPVRCTVGARVVRCHYFLLNWRNHSGCSDCYRGAGGSICAALISMSASIPQEFLPKVDWGGATRKQVILKL